MFVLKVGYFSAHPEIFLPDSVPVLFKIADEVIQFLRVLASPGNYRFTCYMDTELSSDIDEAMEAKQRELVREFEGKHPELTFGDIIDLSVQLSDDTTFAQVVNDVKSQRRAKLANMKLDSFPGGRSRSWTGVLGCRSWIPWML